MTNEMFRDNSQKTRKRTCSFFLKKDFYLFESENREGEGERKRGRERERQQTDRQRDVFSGSFPNTINGLDCAFKDSFGFPLWMQGPKHLCHPHLLFKAHQQGARSEVVQLGQERGTHQEYCLCRCQLNALMPQHESQKCESQIRIVKN